MKTRRHSRVMILIIVSIVIVIASTQLKADTGTCGSASITLPFTDVSSSNIFFCSIAEAFFSGLTNGTSSTTYSPSANVPREQMAAFVTRAMDQSVKRASKRAALRQFWTTQTANNLALTSVGSNPRAIESDGADLWVANNQSSTVSRVRASDGRLLETWTNTDNAEGVLIAMGKIFLTSTSGNLYQIDPTQTAGPVTLVSSSLGNASVAIAFDGRRIWTANGSGSVSIVSFNPVQVTTVTTGFHSPLEGLVYDGLNIWVTDAGDNTLKKLNSDGSIAQSVTVGDYPVFPAFDGSNIWVPSLNSNSVSVVRGTGGLAGTVLASLIGNGLNGPVQAAFDGERILVTNFSGNSVSLWKAADLTTIGTFSTGGSTGPYAACSDGLYFWITLTSLAPGKLARF